MIDLTNLETQLLQAVAGLVLLGALWLVQRGAAYLKIKISDAQKAELEDVAGKALAYGISQAQGLIAARGWDHVSVKSAVAQTAVQYAMQRFPGAMKRADVDTSSVVTAAASLRAVMERKFADAAEVAVKSPVTPPPDAGKAPPSLSVA